MLERPTTWSEVVPLLRHTAAQDVRTVGTPRATLAAFAGDEPIALATLRPFSPDELVQALLELLALLLPLGADRIALSLPGRAWSTEDPIPPVSDAGDLRSRVLLVTLADAVDGPCETRVELHPLAFEDGEPTWGTPLCTSDHAGSSIHHALRVLLDERHDLRASADGPTMLSQFGRVLLRGHELTLAPAVAGHLEALTAP